MMNVLALGLVLTSLLTAGIFTPDPEKRVAKEDLIVKEGHRVVVVEYEKDDGITKVLISPQESSPTQLKADEVEDDHLSEVIIEGSKQHRFSPKELVCDAYGRCRDKVKGVVGRKAHEASDKVTEVEEDARETVGEVRDKVSRATHKAADGVKEVKEKVSEKGSEVKEGAKHNAGEAMDAGKKVVEEAERKAGELRDKGHKELREIRREVREVVVDVFNYILPRKRVASISKIAHLIGFSAAYGMCLWVTFASSYVLAGALSSRQQFSMVQSKIYPVYFKAMAYSLCLALLGHMMNGSSGKKWISLQGFNLLAALGTVLVNMLVLEPRATKVMMERMKKEKEDGKGKVDYATTEETAVAEGSSSVIGLTQNLQTLNSYSSFLNVLTLTSLTWHLVHLAQRLDTASSVC